MVDEPGRLPSKIFSTDNQYAVDLGLVYTVSPKLVLSAAVMDIGQIRWKNEVKQLTLDTTYRYTGADFSDSIDDQANNYKSPEDVLDELTEDIKNEFSFQFIEDSYTEKLPYTISMGAEFRLLKTLTWRNVCTLRLFLLQARHLCIFCQFRTVTHLAYHLQ